MSIRVGGVPYGVGAPLLCGLDAEPRIELVRDLPSRLIERLRAGSLDAALVSSIEAYRRPGYRVAPGLGIASRGAVRSVRAFLRSGVAPGEVRSVGLDDGSETSSALLRILLARRLGARDCEFERIAPTCEPAALPHDLVMLIGDHGLQARPGDRQVLDLGALWYDWTGLPFVFALWLLAPSAPAEVLVGLLQRAAREGRRRGVADGTGGAVHYRIGTDERLALARFADEAAALDLAGVGIEPVFLPDLSENASAQSHD